MRVADVGTEVAVGLAAGAVVLQDVLIPTSGKVAGGLILEEDFLSPFIGADAFGPTVTLLLDGPHAGFATAAEVARVVNEEFGFEAGTAIARADGPGSVVVRVPPAYGEDPVRFTALLLDVGVDRPGRQPRVVVNPRTGTIVVTGEVEISPVAISHRTLTVEVGGLPPDPRGGGFRPIGEDDLGPRPQLDSLLQALNQLRVPTEDVIHILRTLHKSGKLHAEFIEAG